ncbi:hypothetical protein N656DRAFT_747678 [Canariomyces notabilis]|uniref:Fungal-type protein kinase domain-containing protein n=1 Tax=Canariomyces notabilis TaxID=2074819 RepID=A0AAN6YVG5_9PEZI|nr:hypothetical protein N656DRAFT_747678 [Canariomyces arenarius]
MIAVFARGPSVPASQGVLASPGELVENRVPLRGDTVVTFPIRHGHAIREHDGAALRGEFELGPSRLIRIVLVPKLEAEFALQTSLGNETAEPSQERLITTHVRHLKVAILVGLERSVGIDEVVDAPELVAVTVWRNNRLHDLDGPMSRDRNLVKDHDFALGGVKVLVDQSDADALGDIVLAQQLAEVLEIFEFSVGAPATSLIRGKVQTLSTTDHSLKADASTSIKYVHLGTFVYGTYAMSSISVISLALYGLFDFRQRDTKAASEVAIQLDLYQELSSDSALNSKLSPASPPPVLQRRNLIIIKPVTPHLLAPVAFNMDDRNILDNMDGRMHGPMSGFIKRYFGNFEFAQQGSSLEIKAAGKVSGRCTIPSAAPSPDKFLHWFSNYVSRELDGARGSWHISSGDGPPVPDQGCDDDGARLLLTMSPTPASNVQIEWGHVQVIGQFHRRGSVSYQHGLLRLCRSAYQVFASQPTRLFLHGFYIRGSLIELWVFDRSGLYCSDLFDIQKDFIQFLSVVLSYQRTTDQDLGRSNLIETDEGGSYVTINNGTDHSLGKLYLESRPIASSEDLVGTGTTCYRVRMPDSDRWDYVLKFKWRWARERPEDELLELAKEKRVWGAVSLDHYEELESTAHLRRGLRWGPHRKFTRTHSRKKDGYIEGGPERQEVTCNAEGLAEYTEETGSFLQNRILACMVTSPVGRPLHTFQSLSELLQVLRDAIKCHRSLYHDAGVLHQDVSPGNIIIVDGQQDEGGEKPRGIMIDFDSAIELAAEGANSETDTNFNIIGTRPFMAIGVLKGERHTYRHDLESFLYVFLWTVISNHKHDPPQGTSSKLRQWSRGNWDELAVRKSLDMDRDGFQAILGEFPPEFHPLKPLAESLRQIMFPLRDGVLWTGTDGSPEGVRKLYDGIIGAFEEAITSISGGVR